MRAIPLTEWLYEEGIGENRAMLIDDGRVKKIRIERDFGDFAGVKCGAIMPAKLIKKHGGGGFAALADGSEVIVKKWPMHSEGESINVEIIREAITERTRNKPPIVMASDRQLRDAPTLLDIILSSQINVRQCWPHEGDIFAQHGWYEMNEQAQQGVYDFIGGQLIIDEVAAMTVIDVDGDGNRLALAKKAAQAAAQAILLYDLQAMVGIDFPALDSKNDRTLVSQIFDGVMERPCERTGMNGFGFMQVVMKRLRPSVMALLQRDATANAALDVLRMAEYQCAQHGAAQMRIKANPKVISLISQYDWAEILSQRTGRNWQLTKADEYPISKFEIISGAYT